jgi:MFS family permease
LRRLCTVEPDLANESSIRSEPSAQRRSRWGVFGNRAFAAILVASSVSNVGIAIYDTSASWLMTSLNPNPMMVSAVQIATTLPMFLLTVPAGALSDIVDARRLLVGAQSWVAAVSIVFAAVVSFRLATPGALLATTFVLGAAGALAAPAWLLVTPMLVSRDDLDSAIAINSASFNVSRAIGPSLGGLTIAAIGIGFPFWFYCFGNLAILAALLWWRGPRRCKETLPAERLTSAVRTGLRYVRHNRDMDATLVRAVAFFAFASAYWALLPLVARAQMHNGPIIYGALLGMIGLGSIIGSFGIDPLKERLGPDRIALMSTAGTIAALVMYGAAREPVLAMVASLVAGACWIVMMTTLFVSAQVALPDWVRGRGLAILLTAQFGAMTIGSAVWGTFASIEGLSTTFYAAAAGAFVAMIATARQRLQTAARLDLTPSLHWRSPVIVQRVEDNQGPILVTVEYKIDPDDKTPFLAAMQEVGHERQRDGAYAWNVFDDTAEIGRIVEIFLIESLLELKHLRARVTNADRRFEEQALGYLKEPRKVTFLVAPKRSRQKRRKAPLLVAAPAAE